MVRHGGFICRRISSYFGFILVPPLPCRFHSGSMLVPFWFHVGSIWFHFGSIWFYVGSKVLVPRSWYPKRNGEPERWSLSKICEGARGAAGPPPGGLGGWKPPRNCRGSGGGSPPVKIIYGNYVSCHDVPIFFRAKIFRAMPCQDFPGQAVPGIFGSPGPCCARASL